MKSFNTIFLLLPFLLTVSCSDKNISKNDYSALLRSNATCNYNIIEQYEIIAGGNTGQSGSNNYELKIKFDNDANKIEMENFANAYSVIARFKKEGIIIEQQKFPYYQDSVSISGKMQFVGDSLFIEYKSGGPAGQIVCKCSGVKINCE